MLYLPALSGDYIEQILEQAAAQEWGWSFMVWRQDAKRHAVLLSWEQGCFCGLWLPL